MSRNSLPTVTIPASDRQRLEKLTREAMERVATRMHNRAEAISERAPGLDSIVSMGSWGSYGVPAGDPAIGHDEHISDGSHLPVLSPLGAALIGLKIGDEMPFPTATGCIKLVRVEAVRRTEPNVIPMLFCRPVRDSDVFDEAPGPRAA